MEEELLKILQMIEQGAISAAEGEVLLQALERGAESPGLGVPAAQEQVAVEELAAEPPAEDISVPPGPPIPWRRIWIYPLVGGIALLALAALLTADLIQGEGRLGWLACTVPLMTFGTIVALLAWWSRSARWLHIRVREGRKRPFRLSLPLPLHLAAWVLRFIGPWAPRLKDTAVDELILALAESDLPGPLVAVEVNNEEEGEEVRVYIG